MLVRFGAVAISQLAPATLRTVFLALAAARTNKQAIASSAARATSCISANRTEVSHTGRRRITARSRQSVWDRGALAAAESVSSGAAGAALTAVRMRQLPRRACAGPAFVAAGQLVAPRLRPNNSLKLTRYGMRCKPGPRPLRHHRVPGLQRTPPRAA